MSDQIESMTEVQSAKEEDGEVQEPVLENQPDLEAQPSGGDEPSEEEGPSQTQEVADKLEQVEEEVQKKIEEIIEDLPKAEVQINDDGTTRVVRMLSVGQEVKGVVKRITDFGAFVDIGVGRDGLVHISELSVRRVGKVSDVLSEGQEVTAWIKKLDRDRNRISLTLIDPGQRTIRDLEKGELVEGTVTRILQYGAFVDIGIGRDALLHVREMAEGYVAKPEDVVSVGERLEARVIDLSRRRNRVDLSLKGLRPEPEAVIPPQADIEAGDNIEEDSTDEYSDVEVLSPMELAFKKAMEAEGGDLGGGERQQGKRRGRNTSRDLQDEIISRTLDSRRE